MHYRVSPPGTAKGRRAWLFLSLLLPALASKVSTQSSSPALFLEDGTPMVPAQGTRPYLTVIGPPVLRFDEVLPPPDLSVRPPGGAPPKPAIKSEEDDVVVAPPAPAKVVAAIPAPAPAAIPAKVEAEAAPAPKPPPGPPILHDDVPPQVRPEDFLPYFQYPGAASAPGASETIPRSSATYTQDP